MQKAWTDEAWEDYLYWQTQDKKTLRRINNILKDIDRSSFEGIGKPEPLKGNMQRYWSRRIDEGNRIVYKVEKEQIVIVQCGGHYK
ncbi:MAG: Txe/YoeB family addiction module toxin [Clostridiales Family XIII bacterium]|jgi:toxin YoeB|nr:Txe/YoeB family addiction module toxin [Clostridiales Family XIII bacterium]